MIRTTLAEDIISKVRKLLDEDIIVVDTKGVIISSTDENRIGSFHEGALVSYRKRTKFIITKEEEKALSGVKAGINLPIFFNDQIVAIIGITGDPNKVSPYGELLRKMTELLIKESYYFEQLEWEVRTLEAFVFDWIQQKDWSPNFMNLSKLLEIDLAIDRQVIIGHYNRNTNHFLSGDAWNDVMKKYVDKEKDIFVRWGNERVVLLRSCKGNNNRESTLLLIRKLQSYFKEKYNLSFSFGIGQQVSSIELYQSFEQAERAVNTAFPNHSIVFDEDLRLAMCLQDIKKQTRTELVRRSIAPIIEDNELIDTINSFIANNQSFKETAESLHIHINTLHYRLKKIQNLTNLNPRKFHDMTTLYLSLLFLDDYLKINNKNQ